MCLRVISCAAFDTNYFTWALFMIYDLLQLKLICEVTNIHAAFTVASIFIKNCQPFTDERMDYFIVGVTNTSSATQAPVRWAYPLCGQYPSAAPGGARMIVNCTASTPPARYVIIQQPATGPGIMNFCELEVYSSCT